MFDISRLLGTMQLKQKVCAMHEMGTKKFMGANRFI